MGKRSDFERVERDFYPSPYAAVIPLFPHLAAGTHFDEPCCGDGALIKHLEKNGHVCSFFSDIEPQIDAPRLDVFSLTECRGDVFITNPPWDRKILHPLIDHLTNLAPTWLLFDADWAHTVQSGPYMQYCRKIVSIGRVKWIEDSKMTGKDNACWYLFDKKADGPTVFYGRKTEQSLNSSLFQF
jgi:hypothetical protein